MRLAVTGASGLVGTALRRHTEHEVVRLVRRREAAGPNAIFWDPAAGQIDRAALEGVDGVVHLAGENLAEGRWTKSRKERILSSRVQGTRLLARTLAELERKPSVLVSASGVNYYGSRGDEAVDEGSGPGEGFLADVCRAWEAETAPAAEAGIRVVQLRTGPVLSPEGGLLARMLPPFKKGVGGRLGRGEQFLSWIALDDHVRVIELVLAEPSLAGPVNAVAPHPVTNAEFSRTLGRVLGRPAVFAVPPLALKAAFGRELTEEALLGGQRVLPKRLSDAGFDWRYPTVERALEHLLAEPPRRRAGRA